MSSAAFEVRDVGATRFYVEPLVSEASIDDRFVDALADRFGARLAVIASLPDDKDIGGVVDAFAARDIVPLHIVLHGTRGYLSYEAVRSRYPDQILADLKFDDSTGLSSLFGSLVDAGDHDALYVIGTHTFIRTVKRAVRSLEAG